MTGIPQRYLLHALRIELRTCNTTRVNHEQAPECQESRHRVEDLTNGLIGRALQNKKKKFRDSNKPNAKSLHSIPPVKVNDRSRFSNRQRRHYAPRKSSRVEHRRLFSQGSLGLRLGQAVRRQRIRQERKPRNSRERRMANVAIGQKTNSCFVGTTKRSLDA
jgi:hypothetical protein